MKPVRVQLQLVKSVKYRCVYSCLVNFINSYFLVLDPAIRSFLHFLCTYRGSINCQFLKPQLTHALLENLKLSNNQNCKQQTCTEYNCAILLSHYTRCVYSENSSVGLRSHKMWSCRPLRHKGGQFHIFRWCV